MGAAVAGPFAAEQAVLDRKIRRVIAAASPHKPVVHSGPDHASLAGPDCSLVRLAYERSRRRGAPNRALSRLQPQIPHCTRAAPALPCWLARRRSPVPPVNEATLSDPRPGRRRKCPLRHRGTAARCRVSRDRCDHLRGGQEPARGGVLRSADHRRPPARLQRPEPGDEEPDGLSRHGRHHHQRLRRAADGSRSQPVSGDLRRQAARPAAFLETVGAACRACGASGAGRASAWSADSG